MKFLLSALFLPLLLCAQVEFFGYFESEGDIIALEQTRYSFVYHKFRLDLEARPNDKTRIGVNLIAQQYAGRQRWNILDFLPERVRPDPLLISEIPFVMADTLYLDNLYIRSSFSCFDLTLGKQQISPGVGYAWNPLDIFNSKSLLDPAYEQGGVQALKLDIAPSRQSRITGILVPKDNWDLSSRQVSMKYTLGSVDLALNAAALQWQLSPNPFEASVMLPAERRLFGGSVVSEILNWGFWLEAAKNQIRTNATSPAGGAMPSDFSEIVMGVDHTFENAVYLLAEGYHNGAGKAKTSELRFEDYLRAMLGESHSLMQDYGFFYLLVPAFDYVNLSAICITNFSDGSGSLNPQVEWNLNQNSDLSLMLNGFWGHPDSEFGLQDWGLRLRLRTSF